MNRIKALIIGGSYFLGRIFVETLLQTENFEITILNRGRIPFRKPEVRELCCDRHDTEGMRQLLSDRYFDVVIDFCAYRASDIEEIQPILDPMDVKQYIFISTVSVYDEKNVEKGAPVPENTPLLSAPPPESEDYGGYAWNKSEAERKVIELFEKTGIQYSILRPTIIYGKYNYAPRESLFFDRIIRDQIITIPGDSTAEYSFISVWDAATLIMKCIDNPGCMNRAFNLSAPEKLSYREMADVLYRITGRISIITPLLSSDIIEKRLPLPFPPDKDLLYSGAAIARILNFSYSGFEEEMMRSWKFHLIGRGIDPSTLKPAGP